MCVFLPFDKINLSSIIFVSINKFVVCDNSEAYSYVRLNIASYTSGKSYVSIGYMTITGGVPVEP